MMEVKKKNRACTRATISGSVLGYLLLIVVAVLESKVCAQQQESVSLLRHGRRAIIQVQALNENEEKHHNNMYDDVERPTRKRRTSTAGLISVTNSKVHESHAHEVSRKLEKDNLRWEAGMHFDRYLQELLTYDAGSMSFSMSMSMSFSMSMSM